MIAVAADTPPAAFAGVTDRTFGAMVSGRTVVNRMMIVPVMVFPISSVTTGVIVNRYVLPLTSSAPGVNVMLLWSFESTTAPETAVPVPSFKARPTEPVPTVAAARASLNDTVMAAVTGTSTALSAMDEPDITGGVLSVVKRRAYSAASVLPASSFTSVVIASL